MTQEPFYRPPSEPQPPAEEPEAEEIVIEGASMVSDENTTYYSLQDQEPFTLEKGKERLAEAGDRVKQAGKEITTQPFLDALGSYFNRAVDALIGLADGASGKKKDQK